MSIWTNIIGTISERFFVGKTISLPQHTIHGYGEETTPDEDNNMPNNVAIEGPSGADKAFVIMDEGERVWEHQTYRDELGEFWYLYNNRFNREPLVVTEGGRVGFNKQSNIMNYHSYYVNPSTGLLDDMSVGGLYTRRFQVMYEIAISTTGTPNTWKWRRSMDNGTTWSSYSADINCALTETALEYGITIRFDATTGHNTNDVWRFTAFPQIPQASFTVAPSMFDEVIITSNYTAVTPVWLDKTYDSATIYGNPITLLPTGTTSAIYIGRRVSFNSIYFWITTAAIGTTIKVEYWNGAAWTQLTSGSHDYIDETSNLTVSGRIRYNKSLLTNWAKMIPPGQSGDEYDLYWVRITSTTNVTTAPISQIIAPHSNRRVGVYASHLDAVPCFIIDAQGRTLITNTSLAGVEVNPTSTFQAYGSWAGKIDILTDSTTLNDQHYSILTNKGTAITLTIPLASLSFGRTYNIRNIGVGICTLARSGADTFSGDTSITLYQKQSIVIVSDGSSQWRIMSSNRAKESFFSTTADFAGTGTGTTALTIDTATARLYIRHQSTSTSSFTYRELIIPENFLSFPTNALTVQTRKSNAVGSMIATIYRADGTTDATINALNIQATNTNTWETKNGTPSSAYVPGDRIVIMIQSVITGGNNRTQDWDNFLLTFNTF